MARPSTLPEVYFDVFQTRLGWVGVAVSDLGVVSASLPEPDEVQAVMWLSQHARGQFERSPARLAAIRELIVRYCNGEDVDLCAVQIDHRARPPFYIRAWRACRTVKRGETQSYKWLAQEAGNVKGVRAAGQAMANNPFPMLVPCHRIVGAQGDLHGFGGSVGLPMKRKLLEMEGALTAMPA